MTDTHIVVSPKQIAQDFFRYGADTGNCHIAKSYVDGGLNVVPVKTDGTKQPAIFWKEYQLRFRAWFEVKNHFSSRGLPYGIGLICGVTSGGTADEALGLEVADFDTSSEFHFPAWCQLVEAQCPGLVSRLCVVATPKTEFGRHVYWRCPKYEGNLKLARSKKYVNAEGKQTCDVYIETRGQGGYVVAPGSPGKCHASGREYRVVQGDPCDPPVITPEERWVMLEAARSFDEYSKMPGALSCRAARAVADLYQEPDGSPSGQGRPGDAFASSVSWHSILEPHGWEFVKRCGGLDYWRRPGKDGPGTSATTGPRGADDKKDLLHVFSSSAAPFEADGNYGKFSAYALLQCGGDYKAAARRLAEMGYGDDGFLDLPEGVVIGEYAAETLPVNRLRKYLHLDADEPFFGEVDGCESAVISATPKISSAFSAPASKPQRRSKAAKKSAATLLVELVQAKCDLWHAGTGEGADSFLSFHCNGHCENHKIRSSTVERLMVSWFFDAHGKAPSETALREARGTLDAIAVHKGQERSTYIRTAKIGDRILIDLGDAAWKCVEITASGWSIISHSVAFIRPDNLGELPAPERGGSVNDLRRFVQSDDNDFKLLVGWLLDALKGDGPYHVAVLNGEQGSAKSTTLGVLRDLVDPVVRADSEKAREPRDERDLALEAAASHCVSFDNLSKLPQWLSDAFCRIATGGALTTRKLYEDEALKRFTFKRPLILTGIENFVVAGDLASRSLILDLPPIPAESRMLESEFQLAFHAAKPQLLGVLYDALAHGLRTEVSVKKLPRMAESYLWVARCAGEFGWNISEWEDAYNTNREGITETILEGDKTACLLREWFGDQNEAEVKISPQSLLEALKTWCNKSHDDWLGYIPQSTKKLHNVITRLAPYLRVSGLEVDRGRSGKGRVYVFRRTDSAVTCPAEEGPEE